jgi:hypothetical protein
MADVQQLSWVTKAPLAVLHWVKIKSYLGVMMQTSKSGASVNELFVGYGI